LNLVENRTRVMRVPLGDSPRPCGACCVGVPVGELALPPARSIRPAAAPRRIALGVYTTRPRQGAPPCLKLPSTWLGYRYIPHPASGVMEPPGICCILNTWHALRILRPEVLRQIQLRDVIGPERPPALPWDSCLHQLFGTMGHMSSCKLMGAAAAARSPSWELHSRRRKPGGGAPDMHSGLRLARPVVNWVMDLGIPSPPPPYPPAQSTDPKLSVLRK
jgi:hypothetical protein